MLRGMYGGKNLRGYGRGQRKNGQEGYAIFREKLFGPLYPSYLHFLSHIFICPLTSVQCIKKRTT